MVFRQRPKSFRDRNSNEKPCRNVWLTDVWKGWAVVRNTHIVRTICEIHRTRELHVQRQWVVGSFSNTILLRIHFRFVRKQFHMFHCGCPTKLTLQTNNSSAMQRQQFAHFRSTVRMMTRERMARACQTLCRWSADVQHSASAQAECLWDYIIMGCKCAFVLGQSAWMRCFCYNLLLYFVYWARM